MVWAKSMGYSKSKVDWAGDILISETSSNKDKDKAIEILDNWRAIHRYPLHIFKKRLKRISQTMDKDALAVQRLKRLPSILKKLQRKYGGNKATMKLSQMQDIAGCRVVVPNVEIVKKIYCNYIKGDLKHKKVNEKDYITYPKKDGYRSIHLMYRYKSDKEGKKDYNGLLVEVQIRSKLQHLWATAIETMDFFTRQPIKSNGGQKEWVDFFKLVSSAFAIMEKTPIVPDTPTNKKELYKRIKQREEELKVISVMGCWAQAIKSFEEVCKEKPKLQYFLLELNIDEEDTNKGQLHIIGYRKDQEVKAIKDYSKAEKKNKNKKRYDIVLVGGVSATDDLKKAYPNYFADTKEFLEKLKKILKYIK